jgi:hypothetical protein
MRRPRVYSVLFGVAAGLATVSAIRAADAPLALICSVELPRVEGRMTGGEGDIDVLQIDAANRLTRIARVETASGARTSLWIPERNRLYVAVPHRGNQRAEIREYEAR